MWAAGQATQGLGDQITTLRQGETGAGGYLTGAYETGLDEMDTGHLDMLESLRQAYANAPTELTSGRDAALAASRGGYADAGTSALNAQQQATTELAGGRNQALSYGAEAMDQTRGNYADALGMMQLGYGSAVGTLGQAVAGWDPLVQKNMAGLDMYGNALGINGAAGNDAARGAFKAGPGYEWQVGQATDAAQRAANKIGGLYGGNTTDAVTRLGSHLADQEYDQWIRNLAPYQAGAQGAVAGQAATRGALAGVQAQGGQAMAGLDTAEAATINQILKNQGDISTQSARDMGTVDMTTGKTLSDLNAREGSDAAGLYSRTGSGLADLAISKGTTEAKLAGDYASQIAGLAGQYGGTMASLTAGTAGNVASAQQAANNTIIGAGTQGMLAGQQAASNTWGAIMGGLGIGGNLLGASLKSGSADSLLGQLFK